MTTHQPTCSTSGARTAPAHPLPRLLLSMAAIWSLASPALALDLQQAQDAALVQDARVRAARANALSEAERVPQAQALLRPNISASYGTNKNDLDTTGPNAIGLPTTNNRKYTSSNGALSLRQPLLRLQATANLDQARFQADDARRLLDLELQNLSVRVGTAYFQALLATDQLALIEARKISFRTQLDAAQKALQRGTGIRTDIDLAQSRLDMTLAEELEALQNVDYARRQLEVLIGQPASALARLDTGKLQLAPPQPESLAHWVALAAEQNPEVKALQARLEAARLELSKASAGHYPTLDFVAQITRSKSDNVTNISQEYNNKAYGLQLNVPIYAGGGISSLERQAQARIMVAEETLESVLRDLSIRVQKEYGDISAKVLQVKALEQASRSTDVLLDSSKKSFTAGARSLLDVLNAEQEKQTAERNLLQARYEYLAARLRLAATTNLELTQATLAEVNTYLTVSAP